MTGNELLEDLCVRRPLAVPVLRQLGLPGLDPERTVTSTCEQLGLTDTALDAAITTRETVLEATWAGASVSEQIDAIVRTYHQPFAHEMEVLDDAITRACSDGASPQALLAELRTDLAHHIEMEERVLFLLLRSGGSSVLATIRSLSLEHEDLIGALLALGAVVRDCSTRSPLGAEATRVFERFERFLCENIHVETHVLFPRALELARR